jgi:hypothetical protein
MMKILHMNKKNNNVQKYVIFNNVIMFVILIKKIKFKNILKILMFQYG